MLLFVHASRRGREELDDAFRPDGGRRVLFIGRRMEEAFERRGKGAGAQVDVLMSQQPPCRGSASDLATRLTSFKVKFYMHL
jgi:hypothetical protein